MRSRSGILGLIFLVASFEGAFSSEDAILNGLSVGTLKTETEVVIPSQNESPPAPGSSSQSTNFLINLKREEEKTIVDKAFPLMIAKWPFNIVSVCWENPTGADEPERQWVQQAVERSWEKDSALHFAGWGTCTPQNLGIRIFVDDAGPHTKGLGKFISGIKQGMVLNFTFQTWSPTCSQPESMRKQCIESIAVHEFGHAIGFAHEQNRPDTPGECANLKQGTNGDRLDITPWDPHSVMNYCNPVYNNNGNLSEFDIKAVQYVYGLAK